MAEAERLTVYQTGTPQALQDLGTQSEMGATGASARKGLVPSPGIGITTNRYLNETATWKQIDFSEVTGITLGTGTSRLSYVSATQISLGFGVIPLKVSSIWLVRPISVAVTISNSGLSADTTYYVYAFDSSGVTTLEISTTVPVIDSSFGIRIKTGDDTRTLVGRVRTNVSSQFFETSSTAFPLSYGVLSYFNPRRLIHVEQALFGPRPGDGYTVPDGTGNGTYVFLTAVTASTLAAWAMVGVAKFRYVNWRNIASGTNTGDRMRLIHFDDGPANIVQIAEWTANGSGNPENFASNVSTTFQTLQDSPTVTTPKNIGFQVDKINATAMIIYKVALEIMYELDPWSVD